jgi:DNA topoisomerase-1
MHNRKYVSLPKGEDPMATTLETAVALIEEKRKQEQQRHLKSFDEDPKLEILNGRYGPYIAYDSKNYRMPKNLHDKAAELTLQQCMDIVNGTTAKKK